MNKIALILTPLTTLLVCLPPTAPAQAGAPRTFISAAGSDSNNCTNVVTPCRHLAAAFAATAANGEIYVLDPANYGSLTITHAVSIEGHGWASIAPVSGGNAITVNAGPTDKINIIGVVLDGTAVANTTGIQFNTGAELHIVDCVVRNFMGSEIAFMPTVSSALAVSNTFVAANQFQGVIVAPQAANLTVQAVLNRVELHSNFRGLYVYDYGNTGGTINVSVVDTIASNNSTNGSKQKPAPCPHRWSTCRWCGQLPRKTTAPESLPRAHSRPSGLRIHC